VKLHVDLAETTTRAADPMGSQGSRVFRGVFLHYASGVLKSYRLLRQLKDVLTMCSRSCALCFVTQLLLQ